MVCLDNLSALFGVSLVEIFLKTLGYDMEGSGCDVIEVLSRH
jgi:hypothetical protein